MAEYVIPAHLRGRAFSRHEARAVGMHDSELRRRRELRRPTHGVWTTEDLDSLVDRCRAVLPVMASGTAFSHCTAAELFQLPLPQRLREPTALDVMTATGTAPPRRPGWIGHEGVQSREVVEHLGLPVVGLVDTWCDVAEFAVGKKAAMGSDDLVVLGDEIVNRLIIDQMTRMPSGEQPPRPFRDQALVAKALSAFDAVIDARVRPRGKRAMQLARPLLRAGVRSPQETRARLVFVHGGFPEPLVNVDVHDDHGGWLGEGDLVWPERRTVVEYQGGYHADRVQRSKDSERSGAFRAAEWTVHEMWAEDCHPGLRQVKFLRRVAASLDIDPRTLGLW